MKNHATISKPQPEPTFRDVLSFVGGYWLRQPRRFACILFFITAAAFVETNLPNALSAFLGKIRIHADAPVVYLYLGFFLANYLVQVALRRGNVSFFYNRFETQIFKQLLDDAFAHVHTLSERFFVNNFTGSIISRITRARNRLESFQDQIILKVTSVTVIMVGSIFFLSLRFPMLAAMVVVYLVVLLFVSALLVMKVVGPSQSAYADAQDYNTANLADSIASIATTKAYAQEERETKRYFGITENLRVKNLRAYRLTNFTSLVQDLLLSGMLALLLGGGTWYFLQGRSSIEDIAYLSLAYTIIQSYVRDIGDMIKNILTSSYELHAIVRLLREMPGVKDRDHALPLALQGGAIDFAHVSFTYPGKQMPVFHDLSLSIKAGERIALVGHSGSGKTSFVRLVQRLYDIQKGAIIIDGQNIADVTQQSLRGMIASVPQDPILFHRSLTDNIAYGRPQASFDDVRRAAQQAHIDDFIMGLPQQYETLVGERGVKLSGGERQRMAIARAILANRPILILDEATSSLDSGSERAIQEALRALTHGRTSIMIAHRLSTILDADRIVVFDKGGIAEQGTHAELLKKDGIYAGFFRLQSGGFIVE